jgi:hypothetical protein
MWTWEAHNPDLGRPIAAPLEQCADLLGVDLATVREVAANTEPYMRADGTRVWSLMQHNSLFHKALVVSAGPSSVTLPGRRLARVVGDPRRRGWRCRR